MYKEITVNQMGETDVCKICFDDITVFPLVWVQPAASVFAGDNQQHRMCDQIKVLSSRRAIEHPAGSRYSRFADT